jgi:hypothetical protein
MELVVTGITYWFQGVKVTCNADNIIADSGIIGQHYFYFDDVSGTLRESTSVWTLADKVPIASVFWNGTIGAVIDERHGYRRDLEWHTWAHLAVGTRYISGYAHDAQLVPFIMYEGSIRDEDLLYNAANDSTVTGFRIFHQVAGGGWTFVNNTVPWGTTANVQFIDIDGTPSYVPSDVPNSSYINVWIYAAPDISVPYYCALETAVQSYNTVALARAANPPTLSGSGITPELKLLYRLIVRGNESISEVTDYRNASSIPSGGTSSISAAAVQYDNTTSGLTATNAQTAIDETKALIPSIIGLLDTTAHAAIDHTGITGVGGGSGTSVGLTITLGSNTFF